MIKRSQARLLQSLLQVVENGHPGRTIHQTCRKSSIRPSVHLSLPLPTPPETCLFSRSASCRHFTTSNPLSKKGKAPKDTPVPDNNSQRNRDAELDPYDYSELEAGIAKAVERLKEALTKTRSAGRISPETIANLPVQLNIKHEAGSASGQSRKENGRLGDYGTVVPKGGRMMQVFVSEDAYLKPITSAILSSPHSLTSTPDPQNPLVLNIPVPPPTAESRAQAAAEAKKCLEKASLDVRTARGEAQKRHRKMELGKKVVKDELKKAHDGMEKVAQRGQEEVKKVYEGALKGMER